jgi:Tol biopolymer transport system component
VRNLQKNKTTRVSVKSNGDEASPNQNANSYMPSMSASGRFVAFQGDPTAAFTGSDTNNGYDIYVRDRKTNKTKLVSVKSDGTQPTPFGLEPQFEEISANGRYVVFDTETNYGGGADPGDARDVYLRDIKKGKTKLVSGPYKGKHADDNQIADVSNNAYVGWEAMGRAVPGADDGMDWDVYLRGPVN